MEKLSEYWHGKKVVLGGKRKVQDNMYMQCSTVFVCMWKHSKKSQGYGNGSFSEEQFDLLLFGTLKLYCLLLIKWKCDLQQISILLFYLFKDQSCIED